MRPDGIAGGPFSDVILVQKYAGRIEQALLEWPAPLGIVIGWRIHPHQDAIHVLTEFNIESWFLNRIVVLTLNDEKYDTDR
tara:strand:+ start:163 stop:405 length:243 start_codon:yes stop_codon:yes gene_type:complete